MDDPYDTSGPNWLGRWADAKICNSGLWNVQHVTHLYDPGFFGDLDKSVNLICLIVKIVKAPTYFGSLFPDKVEETFPKYSQNHRPPSGKKAPERIRIY